MHSTYNVNDGYLGSGKKLRYSIRKYGKENHIKNIIGFFENRDMLCEAEKKFITYDILNDKYCMNLKEGGVGGSDFKHINDNKLNNKVNQCVLGGIAFSKRLNEDEDLLKSYKIRFINMVKEKHKEGKFNYDNFKGKTHSDETKKKMSKTSKGMGKGENNSQFGTCWVTKENINKKIKKDELHFFINLGWSKGRSL
jgi:hypothetical protein